jgi:hypothetical protein
MGEPGRIDRRPNELWECRKAIPELFHVMERLPDADLGSPLVGRNCRWSIRWRSCTVMKRSWFAPCVEPPSMLSVWMVNHILNSALSDGDRQFFISLLQDAVVAPNTTEPVRLDAERFLEFQMKKRPSPSQ